MNHLDDRGLLVKTMTLATLFENFHLDHVTLLKIDVEGEEFSVIKSLQEKIENVEAILFESAEASFKRKDTTLKEVSLWLRERDFILYSLLSDDGNEIREIGVDHSTKTRYEDILALSPRGKIRFQRQGGKILLS
jgi:hypothetical protein